MDSSQDLTWSNKLVSGDKMSVSPPCHSPLLDRKDYSSLALPSFLSGGHPLHLLIRLAIRALLSQSWYSNPIGTVVLESIGFTLIAGLMDKNHAVNIIPLHERISCKLTKNQNTTKNNITHSTNLNHITII